MSSLYPKFRAGITGASVASAARGISTVALLLAAPTFAAEVYVQPIASVIAQTNSNIDLAVPSNRQQVEGYMADAAAVIDVSTPLSETTFKPRIVYEEFPQETTLNQLEAYLDLNSLYRSQRSTFTVYGEFNHEDDINAEVPAAQYNDVVPNSPTTPETGHVYVGVTRDIGYIAPAYTYQLTNLLGAGVSGLYENITYSSNVASTNVNFNFYQGNAFLNWTLSQRMGMSVGGYVSRYDATNLDSTANSYGETLNFNYSWSRLVNSTLTVAYQTADISATQPSVFKETVNDWGATFGTGYKGETSQLRLSLGQSITPSSYGSLYLADQIQLQYDRNVTERVTFTGALRALRIVGVSSNLYGDNRNYFQGNLFLKWMITRTWFVQGGYVYTWQKYQTDTGSADNNLIMIKFGYQGLPRQR
jgi:hypothetical protein